jgi:solute carrier family 35 protein F5
MTSPLAVTLGMSLTIPLALIGDVYRGTELGGWQIYLGSACVLGSFLVNGFGDLKEVAEQELEAESEVLEGTIAIEHQRLLASVREVEFETEIETEERRSTDRIRT